MLISTRQSVTRRTILVMIVELLLSRESESDPMTRITILVLIVELLLSESESDPMKGCQDELSWC